MLHSRITGLDAGVPESLLRPGAPVFEYWGHEASWLPIELYPHFGFRRIANRTHPWWGDLIGQHPRQARAIMRRVRDEGPLRSSDLGETAKPGWWNLSVNKKLLSALWSCGDLAIRERRGFQRVYDLTKRVIAERWREQRVPRRAAIAQLLLRALAAVGWATTGTLAGTWRLRNMRPEIDAALKRLQLEGRIAACAIEGSPRSTGWIRPEDLELAGRLASIRPRRDRAVLLSPFDPVLWDKRRTQQLFDFDHVMEIFKPPEKREHGYYCLPVLAGERIVARCDLKADRKAGRVELLSTHLEPLRDGRTRASDHPAIQSALRRHADAMRLALVSCARSC